MTRWRPSTCGSTTSTWSAASTCRATSPTRRRPGCSTGCWPPSGDMGADRLVRGGRPRRVPRPVRRVPRAPPGSTDLPDDPARSTTEDRQRLRRALPGRSYPPEARERLPARCAPGSAPSRPSAGGPTWRGQRGRERRCGGCCASATPPTSCSGPTPSGRCDCGWRAPGTGARPIEFVGLDIAAGHAGPAPGELVGYLRRARHDAHAVGAGPRRGAVEPRPFRPASRGQGLSRHPHRRAPRLLRARARSQTSPSCGTERSTSGDSLCSGVDLAATLEGATQGELVGVLEVPADGEAAGDAGDASGRGASGAGPGTWRWPHPRDWGWCTG